MIGDSWQSLFGIRTSLLCLTDRSWSELRFGSPGPGQGSLDRAALHGVGCSRDVGEGSSWRYQPVCARTPSRVDVTRDPGPGSRSWIISRLKWSENACRLILDMQYTAHCRGRLPVCPNGHHLRVSEETTATLPRVPLRIPYPYFLSLAITNAALAGGRRALGSSRL